VAAAVAAEARHEGVAEAGREIGYAPGDQEQITGVHTVVEQQP
jgi:hypothetical protein